jgi:hypothetical protein
MIQVWYGYTEIFDEIVDTFECAGIKCEVDGYRISVESARYTEACAMLAELNNLLEEGGW